MEEPEFGSRPNLADLTGRYPLLRSLVPNLTSRDLYSLARSSKKNWLNIMANATSARSLMHMSMCCGEGEKWLAVLKRPSSRECQKHDGELCERCGFKTCKNCVFDHGKERLGFRFMESDGLVFNGEPLTGVIHYSDVSDNMIALCMKCAPAFESQTAECHCLFFKGMHVCMPCVKTEIRNRIDDVVNLRADQDREWRRRYKRYLPDEKIWVRDCVCGAQFSAQLHDDEYLHQYCLKCNAPRWTASLYWERMHYEPARNAGGIERRVRPVTSVTESLRSLHM
ncbi:uncharacterized protein K452DRAFT_297329 [Aplosporella prunicola CBS 121167]|uniref:Uncharacterized protein n=1 Tax=Aplosporella prunicola CBS 121167 TaxID=1176127 RepID=A0A6A6BFG2_9PEZI|nr:uncharacterized protein K452DRAFT_297329 [Aplosporella prunicola CBS 121167]KAF2142796.1 hypothetical protein K452DRAFT_297329 [Aplosporella prunicola CBS 121167]